MAKQAAEHLDLAGEAHARRAGQELGRPDDGGVLAVGRTEGLVDVGIESVDQPGHEGGVVRLLARIEAQVLGQRDAGAQDAQTFAHGVHLPTGVGCARRAAQVRGRHDLGALVEQALERGQGSRDAKVVGHRGPSPHANVQGHVEVDPDQHALPVDIGEILEEREPAQRVHVDQRATSTLRSTSRFE